MKGALFAIVTSVMLFSLWRIGCIYQESNENHNEKAIVVNKSIPSKAENIDTKKSVQINFCPHCGKRLK